MEELIKELRGLADGSIAPYDTNDGICTHMSDCEKEWYDDWRRIIGRFMGQCLADSSFAKACESWEHFSGSLTYPVPCPEFPREETYAAWMYKETENLWEGEYGELRRDFARHLADYLEKHND